MARISLQEAKDRADEWQAQREDQDRAPNAGHFRDASPHNLIEMWETGKRLDGRRLNNWEFGCLVEAWTACFGDLPPFDNAVANSVAMPDHSKPAPLPADDTMLRTPEVVRLTGISASTIKRMVSDGRFPKPMRIGIRAKGWLARDVRAFVEMLDEQRKRSRQ